MNLERRVEKLEAEENPPMGIGEALNRALASDEPITEAELDELTKELREIQRKGKR